MICPLNGHPCSHRRIIHVTDVKDDQATGSYDLCHLCGKEFLETGTAPAKTHVQTSDQPVSIPVKIIKSATELFQTLTGKEMTPLSTPIKPPCPTCGITIELVNKHKLLGCPDCYAHFYEEIIAISINYQAGATQHIGKRPKNWQRPVPEQTVEEQLKTLRLQFAHAVETEKYERANEFKKQIKQLEALDTPLPEA